MGLYRSTFLTTSRLSRASISEISYVFMYSIENTTLKWSEKFLTMVVHCSSNVILLAIEYFPDSKGERQNMKHLSTQNNYSPSFGLKKLVIFFISSDKKKNLPELEVQNTLPNEAKGWPRHGVWSRGKSAPGHNYREKHRSPTNCLAFEIKESAENIAEYRRKNLFQVFLLF